MDDPNRDACVGHSNLIRFLFLNAFHSGGDARTGCLPDLCRSRYPGGERYYPGGWPPEGLSIRTARSWEREAGKAEGGKTQSLGFTRRLIVDRSGRGAKAEAVSFRSS